MVYPDLPTTEHGQYYPIIWDPDQQQWVAWEGQIKLTGKNAALAYGRYDQEVNLAPGSNTSITIRPPQGELWRIRMLRVHIPAPAGATTGAHRLDVCLYTAQDNMMVLIEPYNRDLTIVRNMMLSATATTKEPADQTAQIQLITSLVCSYDVPLVIYTTNGTDAAKTGTAIIRVIREVEYIHA